MSSTTTPSTPGPQTWLSGDWTKQPGSKPPYNGVKIVATPVYDPQKHNLTTLTLVLSDFTLSKTGADLPEAFKTIRERATIKLPKPAGDLTLAGSLELRLNSTPGNVVLFIDLSWGLEHFRHHANGGILEFPLIDPAASSANPTTTGDVAQDPPSTEGPSDASDCDTLPDGKDRPEGKSRRIGKRRRSATDQ